MSLIISNWTTGDTVFTAVVLMVAGYFLGEELKKYKVLPIDQEDPDNSTET